jgi:hypothetical protein
LDQETYFILSCNLPHEADATQQFQFVIINKYIYFNIYKHAFVSNGKQKMEAQSPSDFAQSVFHFLIMQMKVCCLSVVYKEKNGSYPFANRLNGLALLCKQGILMVHLTPRRCITYVHGNSGVSIAIL